MRFYLLLLTLINYPVILFGESQFIDFSKTKVVIAKKASLLEKKAANIFVEEVEKRSQINLAVTTKFSEKNKPSIYIMKATRIVEFA